MPYGDADEVERSPAAVLGLSLQSWAELNDLVFRDLTESAPYGIRWWAPNIGTSRRILISDYLIACLESVTQNLTEAQLHWLEYLDYADRDNARFADIIRRKEGRLAVELPEAESPLEVLLPALATIHLVGAIRAAASALDCLAGVTIGVVALPLNILTTGFKDVRRALGKVSPGGEGAEIQARFGTVLEAKIATAGPAGWLNWTLDLRNMLVHRGRRTVFGQFLPPDVRLYDADGDPVLRVRRVSHLPRDPARSDIEVFLDKPWSFVLAEDGDRTVRGCLDSTLALVRDLASDLIDVWQRRRANPSLLGQPRDQWPKGRSIKSTGFVGYAPGSTEIEADTNVMNPAAWRRLRAAALADNQRQKWSMFD
jgi:hypothetical protein